MRVVKINTFQEISLSGIFSWISDIFETLVGWLTIPIPIPIPVPVPVSNRPTR